MQSEQLLEIGGMGNNKPMLKFMKRMLKDASEIMITYDDFITHCDIYA